MLDVYICEDNKKQLDLFTKYVSDTILIEALDMQIALSSTDPHILLDMVPLADNTGVFFLDIDLKSDMNGLVLAQRIRQLQPRCFIIFITSHSEMSFMTFQYKVEALDFVIKDTTEHVRSKIHECLLNVHEKYIALNNKTPKVFLIEGSDRCITVDLDEILFFETSSNIHKMILHAKKRVIEFRGQLKDIEKQVDDRFYRCHRSYLINTDNIAEVDLHELTVSMKNGETCPVSVRLKKGLQKILKEKDPL